MRSNSARHSSWRHGPRRWATRLGFGRGEGVETKPIKTSYSTAAATAYIEFEDVKVPVNHLLGKEHQGFKVIMSNFNHERWAMACAVIRWQRTIVEECLKWSNQRVVFGKTLLAQPTIRQKYVSAPTSSFGEFIADGILDLPR